MSQSLLKKFVIFHSISTVKWKIMLNPLFKPKRLLLQGENNQNFIAGRIVKKIIFKF